MIHGNEIGSVWWDTRKLVREFSGTIICFIKQYGFGSILWFWRSLNENKCYGGVISLSIDQNRYIIEDRTNKIVKKMVMIQSYTVFIFLNNNCGWVMGYLAESYQSVPLLTKQLRSDSWSWVYIKISSAPLFSQFSDSSNTSYLFDITPMFDRRQEAPVQYEEN